MNSEDVFLVTLAKYGQGTRNDDCPLYLVPSCERVNFTNVLRAAFKYVSCGRSFFVPMF